VKTAYDENDAGFREKVDNLLWPDGVNLVVSKELDDLRKEIVSYIPAPGFYPAKRTAVEAKFLACSPSDQLEVQRNRDWRDLVEHKFTGTITLPGAPTTIQPESDDMKSLLGIPK
jgi:hypothetical protein